MAGRNRAAVLNGLADTGFIEGRNVAIEYRWVEGSEEKVPAILDDLIERRVRRARNSAEYRNGACREGSNPDYSNCLSRRGGPGR
jgi:hypothetical protein